MINNKDILYIKKGNRETIIYTSDKEIVSQENIYKIFDDWCLVSLTTYEGRIEAIKKIYQIKKLVPIYINQDLMLFPIENRKSVENIYINVTKITKICDIDNKTKIFF
jgi:competence transcription factor ComK